MIASAWGGRLANFKGLLLQFGPEAKCYWDGRLRAVSDCQTMDFRPSLALVRMPSPSREEGIGV